VISRFKSFLFKCNLYHYSAVEEFLNAGAPLTDVKQARLDGYLGDAAMMGRLREMAAADLELYGFALDNYKKQWETRIEAC
jgi:hypothetical protein